MSVDDYPPKVKVDVISQAFIVFGVLMSTFFVTYMTTDPLTAWRGLLMLSFLLGGVSIGKSWGYLETEEHGIKLGRIVYLALFGFAALALTQVLVLQAVALMPGQVDPSRIGEVILSALAAIGEECFFRGVIMLWLIDRTRSPLFGIIFSSVLFSFTHMAAYNVVANIGIGIALFVNGCILGFLAWYTKRLSVSQAAHLLLNLAAHGVFSMGVATIMVIV